MTGPDQPNRSALLAFVGTCILPHEADVRLGLTRLGVSADDRDDILQEVYCRLLTLGSTDHILDPRAYLFKAAHRVLLQKIRKTRVVPIMTMQNLDELAVADGRGDPESTLSARAELSHVLTLIRGLPDRCRQVFILRKVHGCSQAETAARLKVSENVVEKDTAKGLTLILEDLARNSFVGDHTRGRKRKPFRVVNAID
jgi:RNA polymerase sigma-70 factor (ECF subfamily)